MNVALDENHRKEAFLMLVRLQDRGCAVEDSREKVAANYGIQVSDVMKIEQDGIDSSWPPLENRG